MHSKRLVAIIAVIATVGGLFAAAAAAQEGEGDRQLRLQRQRAFVVNDSFVSPLVEVFGDVRVGRKVFVAGNSILRADPSHRVCLGSETNVQDNVLVLALAYGSIPRASCGRRSTSTGERNSIAHQAQIRNSRIGDFTFVGFRARLDNVILEDGAFVLHGATLANVRIRRNRLVPVGAVIRTQAQADALPTKAEAHSDFQNEVLEVNEEFAEEYQALYRRRGYRSVSGISAAPRTTFNSGASPTIGAGLSIEPFARIVGDVRLGANASVGRRTSIRADEGAPITIGAGTEIEDRVTFHALARTSITIGTGLDTDDNVVFHGPLTVGNDLTIADDAVLFRSNVGNNVTIGDSALVIGPGDAPLQIPNGKVIPPNAVITTQAQVNALP